MKHHFLTPLQNAAPHVQSKQSLKLFFSESVDCLVCSDEDLRRNILTDFASINWLTVSTYIYTCLLLKMRLSVVLEYRLISHLTFLFSIYFQWYSDAFISALGGTLSLFLGISLSMLFEVIEFIIDVILNLCLCMVAKKDPRQNSAAVQLPPVYLPPFTPSKKNQT